LQAALAAASYEYIVMLDADTQFERRTIAELLSTRADERVGAVSGHAKVGNIRKWLARFQSLEYACGFNLDRRAYDVWNCISVVPGAVSACRRAAIEAAGGIQADTQAEDTDLTLNIHRAGYLVRYNSRAVAWTEAPETLPALVHQRTRWAFGTIQCLWKNRDLMFSPKYRALAFFSLPSIWFFHIFLVALVPVADVLLILSILSGSAGAIVWYAAAFLLVDLLLAVLACLMERESLWLSLNIIPMRFLYRPLLSYAVWRSIHRVLKGAWVGWDKSERRGSVRLSVCSREEAAEKKAA
jgi:peptidoglycan-N-acetylglucosamine deacetylase